jgi:photosystem II stability/assembly factor-like uncharacterized protein
MGRWGPITVAWLAAAALGAAPATASDAFVDPLDLPALPSALAARSPLAAVAASGGRLVAVGQRGHVLWSEDGGLRWTQATVPVSTDLTALHLGPGGRGWAVGHDGVILATTDGGQTWALQLDRRSLGGEASLLATWFDDERSGVAVGAFGLVLRTGDGGRSWTPWSDRAVNPRGLHLYAVRRVGDALLVAGEQGVLLRLDPSGGRMAALPVPPGASFFGLAGRGRTVVAYGLAGRALRSGDGGASWHPSVTGVEDALTGGAALPDGRLALVTGAGQVLVSVDDGRSFQPAAVGRGEPTAGIAPAGGEALALVGQGGARRLVLRHEMGGDRGRSGQPAR